MSAAKKTPKLAAADLALQGTMLPDEARGQLGVLVTELNGLATVLRTDITVVDHNNVYSAVAEWVDRIAHDLGEMECRSNPANATETAR
jgi:hypothetical protein